MGNYLLSVSASLFFFETQLRELQFPEKKSHFEVFFFFKLKHEICHLNICTTTSHLKRQTVPKTGYWLCGIHILQRERENTVKKTLTASQVR